MSIQKFRTLEDAAKALWREPFDRENLRIAASVTTLAMRLAGATLPKGVFKFATLEEANRAQNEWESAQIRTRLES